MRIYVYSFHFVSLKHPNRPTLSCSILCFMALVLAELSIIVITSQWKCTFSSGLVKWPITRHCLWPFQLKFLAIFLIDYTNLFKSLLSVCGSPGHLWVLDADKLGQCCDTTKNLPNTQWLTGGKAMVIISEMEVITLQQTKFCLYLELFIHYPIWSSQPCDVSRTSTLLFPHYI